MILAEDSKMRKINLTWDNFHDAGSQSEVYRHGNFAIKCPYDKAVESRINHEFEIQSRLFENGVSVPQPYEILTAVLSDRTVRAIKMKFISGKRASKVDWAKAREEELVRRFYEELNKARNLGFNPQDTDLANAIYSTDNKLYLIDFEFWGS